MQSDYPGTEERAQVLTSSWPVIEGNYRVGDPASPVAVCVLTSDELLEPLVSLPGVAIAGTVQTANQGLERIILNITTNPAIRFLLVCGKESRLFRQGQSLNALIENGVDEARRIIDAPGFEPILRTITFQQVATFRRQIELVDWTGERDLETLRACISDLAARNPGRFEGQEQGEDAPFTEPALQVSLTQLLPGGQRNPLIYDPRGYFVITLDRSLGQILLRHYLPDHTPVHEMRGRTAESMLLGLLREGLVSQLSHAGYLGGELAKAESALRLGPTVRYEQDRSLRRASPPVENEKTEQASSASVPASGSVTWDQFKSLPPGQPIDAVIEVTAIPEDHMLEGWLAEPCEEDPWHIYRRTTQTLRMRWSSSTQVVMGTAHQFQRGAILRTIGNLRLHDEVDADQIVVKSKVATIREEQGAVLPEENTSD